MSDVVELSVLARTVGEGPRGNETTKGVGVDRKRIVPVLTVSANRRATRSRKGILWDASVGVVPKSLGRRRREVR